MLRTLVKIGIGIAAASLLTVAVRSVVTSRKKSITIFGRKITGRPAELAYQVKDRASHIMGRASDMAHQVGDKARSIVH